MSEPGKELISALPAIFVLAAAGASSWLFGYWGWRGLSKLIAIAIVRFPLAVLAWLSRVGLGADRLRETIETSAVMIDEQAAKREIRWLGLIDIYSHAIRRVGSVEKPSSLAHRILQSQTVTQETERGRREVLPSIREDKSFIELALGGKDSLRAFLSLSGSGKLDARARAAAVALLARSGDVEQMKVAAFHLELLLAECEAQDTGQPAVFSAEERAELEKLRDELATYRSA
jgi:hypothetical protein